MTHTIKHTCSTLKMSPFLDILLGEVPQPEWWEELHSEYIGLRENKSTSFILDMVKEITYLQTKVFIITKCVEVLAHTYSRDLISELKICGCKGKFDWSNQVQYSNDLRACISYSKKYINQYQKKEKELADYYKRHGGEQIQRKDFDIWAITLGKYQGYRIDFDVVTVAEYCHLMNSYERYCEVENAKNNNLLNNGK